MDILYGVYDNHIEDITLVATFDKEQDADECAKYLNNFNRAYHSYYVEEVELYKSFEAYLIDVKSN